MENRAHALAAGLFVIFLGAALGVAAMWFGGDTMTRDKYLLVSEIPVTGLNSQATVRYRGVTVGKVESIRLDPEDSHTIHIRIAVDRDLPLTKNAFAQLGYQGLTGLAYVQLNDEGGEAERLKTDSDNLAQIPLRPSALDSITSSAQLFLSNANGFMERLNLLFNDQNRTRFAHILENTDAMTGRLHHVIGQLEPGLKTLPGLAADASSVLKHTEQLVVDLNQITSKLNQQGGTIDSFSQTAGELTATMHKLREATEGIQRNSRSVDRVLLQLEEQPRSLLFGRSPPPPGPGEDGFIPPREKSQ
ncbi:phospholipid/cholesterol/gamma-HCH transport system substrate-binding protein [Nitrosospira briensis]|uniref:Phospholipid/cholesterol/gamma-HCH transport system substrate-binding protein n=1 Tax=Nitrosospira briensis TaxID=35799 RepID=A0A1I5D7G5_9PROT|nr:MlaD family protein [Nitrosospira briensis]SFN95214.1 phospholipid/cholesterol/gamma-HCH transport system substrate-binding protein [Nitrosospira briensis]